MDVEGIEALSLVTLGISHLSTEAVEARLSNATPDLSTVVREEAIGEVGETPGERSDSVLSDQVNRDMIIAAVNPGG